MQLFNIQNPNIQDRLRLRDKMILPSEVEIPAIQQSIHSAQSRLAEIESQNATRKSALPLHGYLTDYSSLLGSMAATKVQDTTQDSDSEAVALRAYISDYSSLLAPIQEYINPVSAMRLFKIHNPEIRDRLRLNLLPSYTEKSEIQHSLSVARSRLAKLELEAQPEDPTREMKLAAVIALRGYVSTYSSLLAPIRRLPVEILRLILLDPGMHDRKWSRPVIMTLYRTRAIGGVSYQWREATLQTAILWSSFRLSFDRRNLANLQQLRQQVRIRLERSQNAPLSLAFGSGEADGSPAGVSAVQDLMAEFLLHAERWAHVELPLEYDFLALLSSAQGRLHSLQEVGFSGPKFASENQALDKIKIFEVAPMLRSLSLSQARSSDSLPALPWRQLTQLCAPHVSSLATAKLSALCPSLHDIILYVSPKADQHEITPQRSPKTRSIVLIGAETAQTFRVVDILASMKTPALKEIHLVRCREWHPRSIPALLERSGCSLETLALEQSRVKAAELLALFPAIPTIGALVLANNAAGTVTDVLLEALTPCGVDIGILPVLHSLVLRGTDSCGTDKLLALLESRLRSQHPLRNVDIALRASGASDLDGFAALPGRRVKAVYSRPVLSVRAGSCWQSPVSEKSNLSDQNLTAPDGLARLNQVLVRLHSKAYQTRKLLSGYVRHHQGDYDDNVFINLGLVGSQGHVGINCIYEELQIFLPTVSDWGQ
ncbi:hypothetical protein C8R45DRAFT_1075791 [Mycena sanguinolenta]|nr:hypothetical protein C8R45DRAFT_1075791 [Mycena sanguinolenta]